MKVRAIVVDAIYSVDAPHFKERPVKAFHTNQLREVDPPEFGRWTVLVSNGPHRRIRERPLRPVVFFHDLLGIECHIPV